jgi:hypothetical protein
MQPRIEEGEKEALNLIGRTCSMLKRCTIGLAEGAKNEAGSTLM